MDVPEAWALAPAAGAGVTVAVVDSGAKTDHPDLAGQFAAGGWDYVHGDATPTDNHGHGTHVTGTILARNGNGIGISGVAPGAKAIELQVFADDDGDGSTSGTGQWDWVLDAFDRAGASGARVVNASLGGVGDDYLAALVADTVSQYPNTLYVVAAGNENTNLEPTATVYLPCETPAPNVLCVGASTYTDSRASFSNYGPTAVDVFAPGLNIESTTVRRRLRLHERDLDGDPEHGRRRRAAVRTAADADRCSGAPAVDQLGRSGAWASVRRGRPGECAARVERDRRRRRCRPARADRSASRPRRAPTGGDGSPSHCTLCRSRRRSTTGS